MILSLGRTTDIALHKHGKHCLYCIQDMYIYLRLYWCIKKEKKKKCSFVYLLVQRKLFLFLHIIVDFSRDWETNQMSVFKFLFIFRNSGVAVWQRHNTVLQHHIWVVSVNGEHYFGVFWIQVPKNSNSEAKEVYCSHW